MSKSRATPGSLGSNPRIKPTTEIILDAFKAAADAGELAPTRTELMILAGLTSTVSIASAITRLKETALISTVDTYEGRTITITETGKTCFLARSTGHLVKSTRANPTWVPWTKEESFAAEKAVRAGKTDREIGLMLGRTEGSVRNKTYLMRAPAPVIVAPASVERWTCQNCGIRSDASLDFSCSACRPLRSLAA